MADIVSTQTNAAPAWMQPYQLGFLQQAQDVANMPYQQYQQPLVADMNGLQQQAINGVQQLATNGDPTMNAANKTLQANISGQNLGGNPYLNSQINLAQSDAVRNWNQMAAPAWDTAQQRSGSYGNAGLAEMQNTARDMTQRNIGQIGSNMLYQNYNDAANRQQQSLGLAPTYANQNYNALGALNAAGGQVQAQDQANINANYGQFQNAVQYPQNQVNFMGNAMRTLNPGGTTTTAQPGTSTGAGLLGGALVGSQLWNSIFGGP